MTAAKKALLLGSTGLVGHHALTLLLEDSRYAAVVAPVRRPNPLSHPKLQSPVIDFSRLAERPELFQVDAVMSALGTTLKKAGSRENFRRTDHDLVLEAFRLARSRGARTAILVSAVGADSRSRVFYNQVKGALEDAVRALDFPRLIILRPSLLLGDRSETRLAESVAMRIAEPLLPLFQGPLARYRPIHASRVAQAMIESDLRNATAGVQILEGRSLF